MKVYGKTLRDKQPVMVPVTFREIQCNSFDELKQAHDAGLIAGATKENKDEQGNKRFADSASEKAGKADNEKGHGEDGKAEGSDKEIVCPKCGGKLKNGKCTECGYVMPKLDVGKTDTGPGGHEPDGTGPHGRGNGPGNGQADESGKSTDEEKYYAAIDNSFEWIRDQLNPQVTTLLAPGNSEWCYIEATFSDHVIVSYQGKATQEVYYQVSWEMKDGKPVLGIDYTPVEIDLARVRLTKENEISVQDAMALFVAKASAMQRKQMKELLDTIERSEQRSNKVKQYRGLFHGKTRRAK